MGSSNACMPMKCMAQTPVPITMAPIAHQMRPILPEAMRMRRARPSVTKEANTAMTMETHTIIVL